MQFGLEQLLVLDADVEARELPGDLPEIAGLLADRDDLQIAAPSHQHADVDHAGDRPRRQRQPLPLVRRNGAHENRRKAAVGLLEVDDGSVPADHALLLQPLDAVPDRRRGHV